MEEDATDRAIARLVSACTDAADEDALLASAVPLVRELAGAAAATVLPGAAPIPDPSAPEGWAASGITRTRAHQLPADAGVLLLGWRADGPAEPPAAALAVLDAHLARRAAEHRLADLEARVANAQQLANMGDYDWHIASDTNRWSDQLYRIYGHEPQSFNASYERFLAHIHPDDRDTIKAIHESSYATGEPYQMIERVVRPSGEIRYLSSNGQVVRDDTGTPVRMRGTCVDITVQVLAEQERERTAARFRALVEASPDAILVVDPDGAVVQASGHAAEIFGADPTGRAITDLLPSAREPGQGLPAVGLDGRTLVVDTTVAPLAGAGDDDAVAVFVRDARPRLAAQAAAATVREADVRRRQALELNDTVVQGLTAGLYCLSEGETDSARSFLERTLAAARRMMNDWLQPLGADDVRPGDLIRTSASSLAEAEAPQPDEPRGQDGLRDVTAEPPAPLPRILVVDDNDDVRRLVSEQIASFGDYEVVGQAADGVEAVRLARELRPDVVLLDLAMPRMDGLQALPLITASVPGVRVIVLSGFDQETMAEKALAAGAARYVEKGVRMNLSGVIQSVLTAA